jgi:hypothetical protein
VAAGKLVWLLQKSPETAKSRDDPAGECAQTWQADRPSTQKYCVQLWHDGNALQLYQTGQI